MTWANPLDKEYYLHIGMYGGNLIAYGGTGQSGSITGNSTGGSGTGSSYYPEPPREWDPINDPVHGGVSVPGSNGKVVTYKGWVYREIETSAGSILVGNTGKLYAFDPAQQALVEITPDSPEWVSESILDEGGFETIGTDSGTFYISGDGDCYILAGNSMMQIPEWVMSRQSADEYQIDGMQWWDNLSYQEQDKPWETITTDHGSFLWDGQDLWHDSLEGGMYPEATLEDLFGDGDTTKIDIILDTEYEVDYPTFIEDSIAPDGAIRGYMIIPGVNGHHTAVKMALGTTASNLLYGGGWVLGDVGQDTIIGGIYGDTLNGGIGDDFLKGGLGADGQSWLGKFGQRAKWSFCLTVATMAAEQEKP